MLKRLKNIENKTDEQLLAIKENKDRQLCIKSISYMVKGELSEEAKNIPEKLNNQEKPDLKGDNNTDSYFRDYKSLKELFKAIY